MFATVAWPEYLACVLATGVLLSGIYHAPSPYCLIRNGLSAFAGALFGLLLGTQCLLGCG